MTSHTISHMSLRSVYSIRPNSKHSWQQTESTHFTSGHSTHRDTNATMSRTVRSIADTAKYRYTDGCTMSCAMQVVHRLSSFPINDDTQCHLLASSQVMLRLPATFAFSWRI